MPAVGTHGRRTCARRSRMATAHGHRARPPRMASVRASFTAETRRRRDFLSVRSHGQHAWPRRAWAIAHGYAWPPRTATAHGQHAWPSRGISPRRRGGAETSFRFARMANTHGQHATAVAHGYGRWALSSHLPPGAMPWVTTRSGHAWWPCERTERESRRLWASAVKIRVWAVRDGHAWWPSRIAAAMRDGHARLSGSVVRRANPSSADTSTSPRRARSAPSRPTAPPGTRRSGGSRRAAAAARSRSRPGRARRRG